MPVTWDDAKEKQLLLSIIHFTSPSPPWAAIASAMGEGCSEEACKQKLKKLKISAKAQFGEPPAGVGSADTPKRGKGKKAAGAGKSSEKRKVPVEFEDGDDDEEVEQTPSKKTKMEAKEERGSDEGDEDGL